MQKQRLKYGGKVLLGSFKSVSNVTGKVCYERLKVKVKNAMVKMLEYWKKLEYWEKLKYLLY